MVELKKDDLNNKWDRNYLGEYFDTNLYPEIISQKDIQEPNSSQIGLLEDKSPSAFIHQQYPFRYFTGAQTRLYIEDICIDEAVSLQYIAQAPVVPLYAYDNCKFIRTARGKSIVQGQILINFVDEGYLYYALKDIRKGNEKNFDKEQALAEEVDKLNKKIEKIKSQDPLGSSEAVRDQKVKDQKAELEEATLSLQQLLKEQKIFKTSQDRNIRQALDIIKNGGATGKKLMQQVTKENLFPSAAQHENVVYDKMFFDMSLVFGDASTSVNTYKIFEDCQLVSNSLVVDINSGQHVAESYGFIARTHQ